MIRKILFALAVVLSAAYVHAGEVAVLVNKLAEKGIITYGEAAQIITESEEEARALTARAENQSLPLWIQKMALTGDVRVRMQQDVSNAVNEDRIRARTRVRLGQKTTPAEKFKAGIGIATGALRVNGSNVGDQNPSSTNHTYQGFNKAPLFLDFAYLQYEPVNNLFITGGKVKAKTQVWNTTSLLWDWDINPDGAAVNYQTSNLELNFFANAGWYTLNEQRYQGMPYAYILQPGLSYVTLDLSVKAALAYQYFNIKGKPTGSNDAGNYLGAAGSNNFSIINPSLEITLRKILSGYDVVIFGDYAKNMYDSVYSSDRTGYAFGLGLGDEKIDDFGKWQLRGTYRHLEQNVVPLGLSESDAYEGKAGKGWEAKLSYGLLRDLQFNFGYFNMTNIKSEVRKTVYQLDLVYKF